jgi:hypothetical protein
MSWDQTDKNTFLQSLQLNVGQINLGTRVGNLIKIFASEKNLKTFLEVGTWNGLGTTRCFIEGFKNRSDPYKFYSLECNTDKSNLAARLYADIPNVYILNETLVNIDEIKDTNIIFPNYVEQWHKTDIENLKNCRQFLDRLDLPDVFDVILLDGGEYTTYFEFLKIKNKCKILMLDDTNVDKCLKIVENLIADKKWKLLYQDNERNGFCIFERIV